MGGAFCKKKWKIGGVFCKKKVENGRCFFCKKVDLSSTHGASCTVSSIFFFILHFTYWGYVRTQRTPLPTGLVLAVNFKEVDNKMLGLKNFTPFFVCTTTFCYPKPILIIFGRDVAERVCYQMLYVFPPVHLFNISTLPRET